MKSHFISLFDTIHFRTTAVLMTIALLLIFFSLSWEITDNLPAIAMLFTGLIILKRFGWMKWVLLLILLFEFLGVYDVIRFNSQLIQILTLVRIVFYICAAILLFFAKDIKEQERPA